MAYKPKLLTLAESGTGAVLTASNGGILYSNASTAAVLAGTATAGQLLRSGSSTTPSWSTATFPATAGTTGNVLTSDGTNWASSVPQVNYTLQLSSSSGGNTPVDATVYFVNQSANFTTATASGQSAGRMYIPKAATVTAVYGTFIVAGTLGSAQNCTLALRLNNTTDTTISSTIQLTATPTTFNNSALAIAVVAGDYLEAKFTSATWTTNPTDVSISLTVYLTT